MPTSIRALWLTAAVVLTFVLPLNFSQGGTAPEGDSAARKAKINANIERLKTTCQGDIEKLCSDVTPGEGRIMACFDAKSDQLSPGCKKEWTATQARVSEKMDRTNLALRKNCGKDINQFCSNVPEGRGRILECLNLHQLSLSPSCKKVEARIKQEIAEYLG
jgi:hypothetical protein